MSLGSGALSSPKEEECGPTIDRLCGASAVVNVGIVRDFDCAARALLVSPVQSEMRLRSAAFIESKVGPSVEAHLCPTFQTIPDENGPPARNTSLRGHAHLLDVRRRSSTVVLSRMNRLFRLRDIRLEFSAFFFIAVLRCTLSRFRDSL